VISLSIMSQPLWFSNSLNTHSARIGKGGGGGRGFLGLPIVNNISHFRLVQAKRGLFHNEMERKWRQKVSQTRVKRRSSHEQELLKLPEHNKFGSTQIIKFAC